MAHLLIIDDDDAFRETLAETLVGLGHVVTQAASGRDGVRAMAREGLDAVFLDHRMPGMDGLETLAAIRARGGVSPPVIVLTAYASGANTIDAMKLGAFDHLTKPIGRDAVREVLARALRHERAAATHPPGTDVEARDGTALIGASDAMREVHKRVGLAAASEAPVLIVGETGTGKELVARALHRHSARAAQPFVAVNCAAIPSELLESQLFGHVRGAFTGATGDAAGCFRTAHHGLLLLDEIGDMDAAVQAKILRALQEREVTPVGSARAVPVDVRIVAATHRDLVAAVRAGRFREDLLYRLNVLPIHVPALRARGDDVVPLAEHFLRGAAGAAPPKALSAEAVERLRAYPWPGNVRELKNVMERCQALVRYPVIGAADLAAFLAPPDAARSELPPAWLEADLPSATARLERALIAHALERSQGNRAEAARRLGIHRQLLYRKLRQYKLD